MNSLTNEILSDVLRHWQGQVKSEQFNGLKLRELGNSYSNDDLKSAISELVLSRQLDVLSLPLENVHIKRFPALEPSIQLDYLNVTERYHSCLYPTRDLVEKSLDLSCLNNKPFAKQLELMDSQLEPIAFEVRAIDRYRRDPRFSFYFNDYVGQTSLSITENEYPATIERDKTHIQSFGLGLNDARQPAVMVFLRYLANLTPEHQQHWSTYKLGDEFLMCHQYYKSSILGEYYTNNGPTNALRHCVRIINEACTQIFGCKVFKYEISDKLHFSLSSLMENTVEELNIFYCELDKLVSENIDQKSVRQVLQNEVSKEEKSISLLQRFIGELGSSWSDDVIKDAIKPIRTLRDLRSKPSHTVIANEKTNSVYQQRRQVFGDIIWSLGSIAILLAKHPRAQNISIPKWLADCEVDIL